jgi:hypothetical protein
MDVSRNGLGGPDGPGLEGPSETGFWGFEYLGGIFDQRDGEIRLVFCSREKAEKNRRRACDPKSTTLSSLGVLAKGGTLNLAQDQGGLPDFCGDELSPGLG